MRRCTAAAAAALLLLACSDDPGGVGDEDAGASSAADGDSGGETDASDDDAEDDGSAEDGGGPDGDSPDGGADAEVDAPETGGDATDASGDATADIVPDIEPGDFCDDPSLGSGTTALPEPAAANSFTTSLVECSLSPAEVAACYGARHMSTTTVTADAIVLTSNAIPNHDTGLFPNDGNPNVVSAQNKTYRIPLSPTRDETPTSLQVPGVALNGVKMEPETAEVYGSTAWRYEALTFLGRLPSDPTQFPQPITSLGADCNFAHVQPTGEYHYHGNPTALMPDAPARVQVGWAADGYPIYGRFGFENPDGSGALVELVGGYAVRSGEREALQAGESPPPGEYDGTFVQDWVFTGAGDLDACNGRAEANVIDGRAYDYAYYLTHTYPFIPRCVWGEPGEGFAVGGGGGGPTPASCETSDDCDGACFDGATGCTCIESPRDGMICVPTCESDGDCPDGQVCGPGFCVPAGGPP